eukprot:gene22067-30301_t
MKHSTTTSREKRKGTDTKAFSIPLLLLFAGLLFLVIWDMRKVHEMSELIHDDHTSEWEKMNSSSLNKWLTPLDICMLQVSSPDVDLKQFRSRNCSKLTSVGIATHRLYCNIGSSLGKQCAPPLSANSRKFFNFRLKNNRYGDPSDKFLNVAVERLARENKAILFIGDGISKQNHDALLCEIMRSESKSAVGLTLGTLNSSLTAVQGQVMSNFTLQLRKNSGIAEFGHRNEQKTLLSMSIFFLKMVHIFEPGDLEMKKKVRRRRSMQKGRVGPQIDRNERLIALEARDNVRSKRRVTQIDRKYDNVNSNNDNNNNNNNKIKVVAPRDGNKARVNATIPLSRSNQNQKSTTVTSSSKIQRSASDTSASSQRNLTDLSPYPSLPPTSYPVIDSSSSASESPLYISLGDIKEATAEILRSYSGVVVIANVGAWYNSRERFRKELPEFINWLNDLGRDDANTVFFRETAAQHWNHTDIGYFDDAQRLESNGTCIPISDSTPEFDWRNRDVAHYLENNDLKDIKMVRFHDITAPLFNMHPTSQSPAYPQQQDCTHFCYFPQMWQSVWYHLYSNTLAQDDGTTVAMMANNSSKRRSSTGRRLHKY